MEIIATDNNFNSLIKDDKVIVDFYANWCMPCKALAPIIKELTDEMNIKLVKVNVDECPNVSQEYGIMSIPTIIYFKDNKEINRKIGLCSKSELKEFIK